MAGDSTRALALAMGVLGTAGDFGEAAGLDEMVALRKARGIIVERLTPPRGVQQSTAVAEELAAILRIIDAALAGQQAPGLGPFAWAERQVQRRLAADLDI